jgi:hypothetical protein
MEIDMFVEIHDYLANRTAAVEVYLGAKAQFEAAEAVLKAAKKDVVTIVGGFGFLEGVTADLDIDVQCKKPINEQKLMDLGLTKAQIDACKVEGEPYPIIRIKAKKVKKAA